MKTKLSTRSFQQGNTLLVTIVVTGIIGFLLLAFLTLMQHENTANMRSQAWNSAMPVVEAGIEEALAHLNQRGITNGPLDRDGWAKSGNTYSITHPVGDSFYHVTIDNYIPFTTNTPVIESKAYVTRPLTLASAPHRGPFLVAAINGNVEYLGRGVRARTHKLALFAKGMVAKDSIDMNGNNIETDSFDSQDPRYSTNGNYIISKRKDSGDVAVNSSITNSLNAGNANIRGHVSTGPKGVVAVGSQGVIGSGSWVDGNNHGIEPGYSSDDMNVAFDNVTVPFAGGFTPSGGYYTTVQSLVYPITTRVVRTNWVTTSSLPAGAFGLITTNGNGANQTFTYQVYSYITPTNSSGTYYNYVLTDGNYQIPSLTGSILVLGDANVYASALCNVSGLTIEWGKHLNLYSSAPSVALSGNNTANSDGTADSFAFWGLNTCRSISFSGNSSFTGTIYAPNADFTLNGSGNNVTDFVGASITKSVKLNGHFNFHYDEALQYIGPSRGFIVTSWSELSPSDIPPASSFIP